MPEVLNELPPEEPEDDDIPLEGDPELYRAIKAGNHRIILTLGIQEEYFKEAQKVGFRDIRMLRVIRHLEQGGLTISPRLPGGKRNIPGLPQRHRAFLTDAILSRADYFLTENPVWLRLADMMLREHRVRITTPGDFVRREGIELKPIPERGPA
jgi:hypothetical protein